MLNDEWSSGQWSILATGDKGPWVRYLPLAWQIAADPKGRLEAPRFSNRFSHGELIAYWSPIAQLAMFGLGWAYPFRGLARWDQADRPTDGGVLDAINRWCGPHLEDLLAWGADYDVTMTNGPDLTFGHRKPERGALFQKYWHRTSDTDWVKAWTQPGSNPLHLSYHLRPPWESGRDRETPQALGDTGLRRALIVDEYVGWYRSLMNLQGLATAGRSARVDVVVRPLGWLGTYRKSRRTGLWFTGKHSTHVLGNDHVVAQ